jgi:hypothetical protein
MKHIFLDTNIFIRENFFDGKKINELFRLSESEHFKLVLTIITIEEIKSNFKKHLKVAFKNHEIFMEAEHSRVLRNDSMEKNLFRNMNKKAIIANFNKKLDDLILTSNVEVIEYSKLDIKKVFDRYFANTPPFHHPDKKNEFPDAFAVELLEQWCEEEDRDCLVLTLDKGIKADEGSRLCISDDYEGFLDSTLRELLDDRMSVLEDLFERNSTFIDNNIKEWYEEKLGDESLYHHFVFEEIHDIEVVEINILEKAYAVVSTENESINIEVVAQVEYVVRLTIDDSESSVYDYEDKVTLYFDTAVRDIKGNDEAVLNISTYIMSANNYEDFFDIIDINEGFKFKVEDDTEWY